MGGAGWDWVGLGGVGWNAAGSSVGGREHTGCALTGPHWSPAGSGLWVERCVEG